MSPTIGVSFRRRALERPQNNSGESEASASRIAEFLGLAPSQNPLALSEAERVRLCGVWGREAFAEARALARERDPLLFAEGLFRWAGRLENQERLGPAVQVYQFLASHADSPALRRRADLRRAAVMGEGAWQGRAEVLGRRFAREIADPAALAAMTTAGLVFRSVRLGALSRLALNPETWWSRGLGARFLAGSLAFSAEVPSFVLTSRLLRGPQSSAGHPALADELASAALTLGGLRFAGWALPGLMHRLPGAGRLPGLRNISAQAGMFSGILLGHRLQETAGLRETRAGATTLLDSLVLLAQFNIAGRLTPSLTGPDFAARESALEASIGNGTRLTLPPLFSSRFPRPRLALASAASESSPLNFNPLRPSQDFILKMESSSSQSLSSSESIPSNAHANADAHANATSNSKSIPPPGRLNLAIIGGGMSGLFAALSLTRKLPELLNAPEGFHADLTLITPDLGGKVQPNNEGGQFIDSRHSFPLLPWIHELGIRTFERPDYDLADCLLHSGTVLPVGHVAEVLRMHRHAAREVLSRGGWKLLDGMTAEDFIRNVQHPRPLTAEEMEALEIRLGVEEGIKTRGGSLQISALSYALNMAKSDTPMNRLEVDGGPYRMVESLAEVLREEGVKIFNRAMARRVHVLEDGVRLVYEREGVTGPVEQVFDGAILAVAPEHFSRIEILFADRAVRLPISFLSELQATKIAKTNVIIEGEGAIPEWVTPRFASWESPLPEARPGERLVSFFHGMDGENPLPVSELMARTFLEWKPRVVHSWTRFWDTEIHHGAGSGRTDGYTTMPGPGQGYSVARFVQEHYFGAASAGPLWLANHVMGLGCYMHNAALSGYLASRAMLRARGFAVRPFETSQLYGVPPPAEWEGPHRRPVEDAINLPR